MKVTFKIMAMAATTLPLAMLAACGGSGDSSSDATPAATATSSAVETTPAAAASPAPASSAAPTVAAAADATATAAAPAAGGAAPASFATCKVCHAAEAGKNGVGPTLHGIVGSKAGDVPGFAFSPALKGSGIVWDRAKLDTWLQGPMKMVPGTKMVIAVPDAAKRKEIIDYLETLK